MAGARGTARSLGRGGPSPAGVGVRTLAAAGTVARRPALTAAGPAAAPAGAARTGPRKACAVSAARSGDAGRAGPGSLRGDRAIGASAPRPRTAGELRGRAAHPGRRAAPDRADRALDEADRRAPPRRRAAGEPAHRAELSQIGRAHV